ncbi:MAG TPA: Eco57I restriction-modification methylase domain-containing protein [Candidatus Marinimicrobia bacterium]|nr:Eco57I restriction-modification methylase domain-containing protein [Candidatus Neomarinimicrobiota bacterium]MDP6261466.1 Eco57I restriction-modification methylase domain-containing protein [Candidatus Neomarinimicrobiota bacterium]MDP7128073.1 Eco57I restriction-modification methylase domain-containing protein [Candidatus Neomarinimicrobiota bacterium]MDP7336792.1 Eco57I restriction-modification methylase domain-containing protein [Candidatus Neomarinimicrobiota bacterium]MDP7475770.1 Eco5
MFTPNEHALFMVREAIFWRLVQDFPNVSHDQYHTFITGLAERRTGENFLNILCEYQFQDPSAGDGIFLETLCREIYGLCKKYDYQIKRGWEAEHVHGWEINSKILEACKRNMSFSPHLIHSDYLNSKPKKPVDVIIANPPYVRQEYLSSDYKQKLIEQFQPEFPGIKLSVRCDLYIYFLLKVLKNLNKNGVFTFIIPNSWMDNSYGEILRTLFRDEFQLLSITDSGSRHFKQEVNTVIISGIRKNPAKNNQIIVNLDQKSKSISQERLRLLDLGWHGSLFRCPSWLLKQITENKALGAIGDEFSVCSGIITGNNRAYYHQQKTDNSLPAIRSPKETTSIRFTQSDVQSWIQKNGAGFSIRKAPLLWIDLRGGRHVVIWNQDNLPFEHTFYGLHPKDGKNVEAWAYVMNSSWVWLMVELFGRRGLGGGAVRLVKNDLVKLPIPLFANIKFPSNLSGFLERPIYNWRTELEQEDRKRVDDRIFKAIGMGEKQKECMILLRSLMEKRESKARSVHD